MRRAFSGRAEEARLPWVVPGSPVPQSYIQHEMVKAMGFAPLYEPGMRLFEMQSSSIARLRGVSGPAAQRRAIGRTLAAGALAAASPLALCAWIRGSSGSG